MEGVDSLDSVHAHNRETVAVLLRRGREQGTIRDDLTTEDLLVALAVLGRAVPALTSTAPDAWRRPLALLLDGLRASPTAAPLPEPSLTPPQLGAFLGDLGPHRD